MIEAALVTRAAAVSGLTALIGSRFYPQMMPQNPTYPAVTYFLVAAPRETAMGADPGIVYAHLQLSAWSTDYLEATNVAEQLRGTFQRWRGTVGSVEILDTLEWMAHDAPPDFLNNVVIRQRICECKVIYRET